MFRKGPHYHKQTWVRAWLPRPNVIIECSFDYFEVPIFKKLLFDMDIEIT